jgi:hypothetical protein
MALTISTALVGGYSNPMFDVLRTRRSLARVALVLIACSVDVMAEAAEADLIKHVDRLDRNVVDSQSPSAG